MNGKLYWELFTMVQIHKILYRINTSRHKTIRFTKGGFHGAIPRSCSAQPKSAPVLSLVHLMTLCLEEGSVKDFADFGSAGADPADDSVNSPSDPTLGAREIYHMGKHTFQIPLWIALWGEGVPKQHLFPPRRSVGVLFLIKEAGRRGPFF